MRCEALEAIRAIQLCGPAEGKVDHAKSEALLATVIRALRDGKEAKELSFAFQWLLTRCLDESDESDPERSPDGLVEIATKFTKKNTLDVNAQMVSLNSNGQTDCIDPFHAIVTIDADGTTIERATIEYGDATKGIGSTPWGSRGVDPRTVKNWAFRFQK